MIAATLDAANWIRIEAAIDRSPEPTDGDIDGPQVDVLAVPHGGKKVFATNSATSIEKQENQQAKFFLGET